MKLTLKDFERMEEIDHQYFPKENISPAKEAYKWYLADPHSCIAIKENSQVVAYINILSLKEEVYNKVKYNQINESQIKVDDLELEQDKYFNYLYFSTIAVDKGHRNIKTILSLINNAKKLLNDLKPIKIIEVMADCSTKEGQKITQRILKLKPFIHTSHDSIIHILDGKAFLKNMKSNS